MELKRQMSERDRGQREKEGSERERGGREKK